MDSSPTTSVLLKKQITNPKLDLSVRADAVEYKSVHDIAEIKDQIDFIASEILRITLEIKHKNIKDINKNFQATLTNYFLECQVCQLLTKPMNVQYKRDVRKIVEKALNSKLSLDDSTQKPAQKSPQTIAQGGDRSAMTHLTASPNILSPNHISSQINNISMDTPSNKSAPAEMLIESSDNSCQKESPINGKRKIAYKNCEQRPVNGSSSSSSQYVKKEKTAKYIMLIGIYGEYIDSFGLQKEYIEILLDNIRNNQSTNALAVDSQKYITLFQKKLCAILVLEHYLRREERTGFKSFCDLWNSVFLNHKLFYFARETNEFYNKIKNHHPNNSSSPHQQKQQIENLVTGSENRMRTLPQKSLQKSNLSFNVDFCQQEEDLIKKRLKKQLSSSPSATNSVKRQQITDSQIIQESRLQAQFRLIPQSSPTVSLNYFQWAEQAFFRDDLCKAKNLLKILPVQLAVQMSNDLSPESQNYIKQNAKLILFPKETSDEDFSSTLRSSASQTFSQDHIPTPIQKYSIVLPHSFQKAAALSDQNNSNSRDKKQTQLCIPQASLNTIPQKCQQLDSIQTNYSSSVTCHLTNLVHLNDLMQKPNYFKRSQSSQNEKVQNSQIFNNLASVIKQNSSSSQNIQCIKRDIAKYRLIQQKNVIYPHPASQKFEYLQQFFGGQAAAFNFGASGFN